MKGPKVFVEIGFVHNIIVINIFVHIIDAINLSCEVPWPINTLIKKFQNVNCYFDLEIGNDGDK